MNNCVAKKKTFVAAIFNNVSTLIGDTLKPILEKWTSTKLHLVSTFGPRRYLRGSTVDTHVDKPDNRVIGAIINIGQDVEQDWMLRIVDNFGIIRDISMRPGDVVLYESAKVPHGRPSPLQGVFYDNMLAHFVPQDWNYKFTRSNMVQEIYEDYKIRTFELHAKRSSFCSSPIL